MLMNENSRIYVAGHRGLVGSAIWRELERQGFKNLIGRTRPEVNLLDAAAVQKFFAETKPEFIFYAAAKVGGIHANHTQPAEFIYQNLMIATNLIHGAWRAGVKKLLFLGSTCIYPKLAPQPIREDALLTGALEPTNEAYAVAKIAGLELCKFYRRQYGCDFISAMPTNLYGPHDNFHPETSHVLPAMLRKFHDAKVNGLPSVTCWGTGTPRREFLHVDDLADACLHLLAHYTGEQHVNVGTGEDLTIRELAERVAATVGYQGRLEWDATRPDGTPRKLTDVTRLHALGWHHRVSLPDGLRAVYAWYREHVAEQRS